MLDTGGKDTFEALDEKQFNIRTYLSLIVRDYLKKRVYRWIIETQSLFSARIFGPAMVY